MVDLTEGSSLTCFQAEVTGRPGASTTRHIRPSAGPFPVEALLLVFEADLNHDDPRCALTSRSMMEVSSPPGRDGDG